MLSSNDKAERSRLDIFLGHAPGSEQRRHPLWVGWMKEFRTLSSKDDPVRHERLAAIGKNGTQIRLYKKDDVLFREPFYLENEVH